VAWPVEPDLAPRIRERLTARHAWTRPLVVVLAVLLIATGVAVAVPQARSALLRWVGLSGVRIRRVDQLPETPIARALVLGQRVSLAEARRRASYRVEIPAVAPTPETVYFDDFPPGGGVSFVYGRLSKPRLLLTQFIGTSTPYIDKLVSPGTRVEAVQVGRAPGYWISGRPHGFAYADRRGEINEETLRLAGNTLLWQQGVFTFRLEWRMSKDEALAIARSVR
jgi:hypothetical protein